MTNENFDGPQSDEPLKDELLKAKDQAVHGDFDGPLNDNDGSEARDRAVHGDFDGPLNGDAGLEVRDLAIHEDFDGPLNNDGLEARDLAVTDDPPLINLTNYDLSDEEDEDELGESNMSLVDHLEELRWRIFKCLIVIAVGFVIAFIFRIQLINFLEAPLPSLSSKHLVVTGLGEGFTVTLMVSFAAGFAFSLPVILYQTWAFIAPGLYEKEKKYAVPFIFIGIILFTAGLSLAYYVLRYPVEWLITFAATNFTELVTASSYFGFVAFFLLAFGITFELPLVLTFLAKVDLITIETLKKKRSTAHIGMWVAAAVLVPGADPYTPIILGAAMSILYEISIIFIKLVIK